jgi:hypothetical protein
MDRRPVTQGLLDCCRKQEAKGVGSLLDLGQQERLLLRNKRFGLGGALGNGGGRTCTRDKTLGIGVVCSNSCTLLLVEYCMYLLLHGSSPRSPN